MAGAGIGKSCAIRRKALRSIFVGLLILLAAIAAVVIDSVFVSYDPTRTISLLLHAIAFVGLLSITKGFAGLRTASKVAEMESAHRPPEIDQDV